MAKGSQQQLMRGALLLTVTSFIVKILSAIYRVPFQNMVGNEGFYVYQQVYPIYGIAMTLALSGLPVFLSKLVAEQGSEEGKIEVIKEVFPLIFWLSMLLFSLTFFGDQLLAKWMGDVALAPLIKVVAIVFLLTPFLTSLRGYFQGSLVMEPTAYSQLWEQVLRVGVILVTAFLSTKVTWSIYQVGEIAMAGALVGGVGALFVLLKYPSKLRFFSKRGLLASLQPKKQSTVYVRRFLVEGGLICSYSSLLVIFQLVDSFVIKNQLVVTGLTEMEAKITKGIFDRGQPLIQVGLVIAMALTTSFLPTLTKYHAARQSFSYERSARTFLKLTYVIASGASLGLIMLLPYINHSLFGDNQEFFALSVLMVTVLLMSVVLAFQTLFQSRNHYRPPLLGIVVGCLMKVVLSPILTQQLGTVGASLSTLLGLTSCLAVLVSYERKNRKKNPINGLFLWQLLKSLGMMVISLIIYRILLDNWLVVVASRGAFLLAAIGGVLVGGSVLVWSIVKVELFTIREWLGIPMGKKLLRLKNKRN